MRLSSLPESVLFIEVGPKKKGCGGALLELEKLGKVVSRNDVKNRWRCFLRSVGEKKNRGQRDTKDAGTTMRRKTINASGHCSFDRCVC